MLSQLTGLLSLIQVKTEPGQTPEQSSDLADFAEIFQDLEQRSDQPRGKSPEALGQVTEEAQDGETTEESEVSDKLGREAPSLAGNADQDDSAKVRPTDADAAEGIRKTAARPETGLDPWLESAQLGVWTRNAQRPASPTEEMSEADALAEQEPDAPGRTFRKTGMALSQNMLLPEEMVLKDKKTFQSDGFAGKIEPVPNSSRGVVAGNYRVDHARSPAPFDGVSDGELRPHQRLEGIIGNGPGHGAAIRARDVADSSVVKSVEPQAKDADGKRQNFSGDPWQATLRTRPDSPYKILAPTGGIETADLIDKAFVSKPNAETEAARTAKDTDTDTGAGLSASRPLVREFSADSASHESEASDRKIPQRERFVDGASSEPRFVRTERILADTRAQQPASRTEPSSDTTTGARVTRADVAGVSGASVPQAKGAIKNVSAPSSPPNNASDVPLAERQISGVERRIGAGDRQGEASPRSRTASNPSPRLSHDVKLPSHDLGSIDVRLAKSQKTQRSILVQTKQSNPDMKLEYGVNAVGGTGVESGNERLSKRDMVAVRDHGMPKPRVNMPVQPTKPHEVAVKSSQDRPSKAAKHVDLPINLERISSSEGAKADLRPTAKQVLQDPSGLGKPERLQVARIEPRSSLRQGERPGAQTIQTGPADPKTNMLFARADVEPSIPQTSEAHGSPKFGPSRARATPSMTGNSNASESRFTQANQSVAPDVIEQPTFRSTAKEHLVERPQQRLVPGKSTVADQQPVTPSLQARTSLRNPEEVLPLAPRRTDAATEPPRPASPEKPERSPSTALNEHLKGDVPRHDVHKTKEVTDIPDPKKTGSETERSAQLVRRGFVRQASPTGEILPPRSVPSKMAEGRVPSPKFKDGPAINAEAAKLQATRAEITMNEPAKPDTPKSSGSETPESQSRRAETKPTQVASMPKLPARPREQNAKPYVEPLADAKQPTVEVVGNIERPASSVRQTGVSIPPVEFFRSTRATVDAKSKTEDYEPARPTDGRGFDRNPSGSSMRLYPGELRSEVIRSGSAAPVIGIPSPGGPAQAPSVRPVESGGASLSPIAVEAPTGLWKSPNNTARPTEAAPTQVVSPLPFQRSRIAENPRESRRLDRFVTSRSKVVETPKPGGQVGEAVHKAFARTPTLNAQSSQSKLLSPFLAVPEDESADESTLMTSPSDRLSASNASQVIVPATRAAQAQVSIMRQVAEALSSVQDDTIELQLDPEELGRVQFRMVHAEHGLVLNIIAERPETLDLLRRNAEHLAQHFADMGYSGAEFSFQEQGQGGEERSGLGGESAPSVDADTVPDHSIQTMAPMEGLDIRI